MSEPVSAYVVFTPGSPATLNFIPRQAQSLLESALNMPGMQVIVYGESGSGKSTLLKNELPKQYTSLVTTRCTSSSTFDGIILHAFDSLDEWVTTQITHDAANTQSTELAASISGIKAGVGQSSTITDGTTTTRLLPPQLTPQKLGELLGRSGQCWVIEDFHKVKPEHKAALAQTMKVFSDMGVDFPSLRMIVVGATDSARDVVAYDSEMAQRVSEIYIPPLVDSELRELVVHGGELLNVEFDDVVDGIVHNAFGSGSVAHQLALNCVLSRGIKRRSGELVAIDSADLRAAGKTYVHASSATLKARFDKGLYRSQSTGFDNCRLVLTALAKVQVTGALHGDLLASIRRNEGTYPSGNLTTYLKQLATEERGRLVQKNIDGRFSFSEPLLHTYARLTLLPGQIIDDNDIYLSDLQTITINVNGSRLSFEMPRTPRDGS